MSRPYRFPAVYVSHGGGPWPFMDLGPAKHAALKPLADYLGTLVLGLPQRPRAVLMVSAHWEEPVATLMTSPRPPMLYDYYNFPASTYTLQWPAPGAPDRVASVSALLGHAGFEVRSDPNRGFDHGTFVPMMLALPKADLPVLQLSLLQDMDPARHLAMGEALAPLRDEGVLLLGSGNSYHNMRGFGQASSSAPSKAFDDWLVEAVGSDRETRRRKLIDWAAAPGARACHPREEHLLPLHVMAGAAGTDRGRATLRIEFSAVHNTCVQFGG
jgi:aromatic ring-opening dioxygenase catalytic subunit (LigB family)